MIDVNIYIRIFTNSLTQLYFKHVCVWRKGGGSVCVEKGGGEGWLLGVLICLRHLLNSQSMKYGVYVKTNEDDFLYLRRCYTIQLVL